MKTATALIPFAGSQLGEARHVCAFFNSQEEEYRVLLPFIRDGFATVVDIMRTHPMIIIGGILQQNPFFLPPEEFLGELRGRRGRQTTGPLPRGQHGTH